MNPYQRVWWQQVQSDYSVLLLLRREGAAPCRQLHYLQMVTEKLAKAYLWRHGPRSRSHAWFVIFLRALLDRSGSDCARIARCLGLSTAKSLEDWVAKVIPLAHALERLAPNLAGDGPNPEYPWPHAAPTVAPALHQFQIWTDLTEKAPGRRFLARIDSAVLRFPDYA